MRPADCPAARQPKANVEGASFQSAFSIWNLGKVLRLEKYTLLILGLALPKRTGKKCCRFSLDEEAATDAIDIYVHRLRKKLEHSSAKSMTLRGLG